MSQTLAFLGANSHIARDLIRAMVVEGRHRLLLYVRDVPAMQAWLIECGLTRQATVYGYDRYDDQPHDAVLNFVGVGNPVQLLSLGKTIFDVTLKYDELALTGLRRVPGRRYLFLSSGAVYGDVYHQPVSADSSAVFALNSSTPHNWYAVSKLHAEVRHRASPEAQIIDLRVFNYFSRTQDLSARFFITDLVRAIHKGENVRVSSDFIMRDFIHPTDFHQMVECLLAAPPINSAVDCYSASPVAKSTLLDALQERFGLIYEVSDCTDSVVVNVTGAKPHYYSLNRKAESYGYVPTYTSLAGVLEEVAAVLAEAREMFKEPTQ
jgi:nucleoside-diphosphate-sugar epimerase